MEIPVEHIKSLVELMVSNDLSRIELREGDALILLRRGQPVVAGPVIPAGPISTSVAAVAAPAGIPAPAAPAAAAPAASPESTDAAIRSPMVGTYYASPSPDAPAFVSVGDFVKADTTVCLIEAMKVFNEIKAEVSGRITKILAKNAQAVEYDQPLFTVAPA